MPVVKLESKLGTEAAEALEELAPALYGTRGARILGVVELWASERSQVEADSGKIPYVKLTMTDLEIANSTQEDSLREAMRALYLHRTAHGTLDVDGELELSSRTVELTAGNLHAHEAARLRATTKHWADYADRVLVDSTLTSTELRHEIAAVVAGMKAALLGAEVDGV